MKTAKEMFEELGYYASYDYYNPKVSFAFYKKYSTKTIVFNIKDKTIDIFDGDITLDELKAINQQIKELHWND